MKLSNIAINPYPPAWQNFLTAKRSNFVPRNLVVTAFDNFRQRHSKGYFTLVGPPGSGKSAVVANLVAWGDGEVVTLFYPVELNRDPNQFLPSLNALLPHHNAASLSLLLQQLSQQLQPQQKLIIAIDGLDRLNYHQQPPGSNLLYLPRYLPDGVYFLLTRRPFPPGKSHLLTETPCGSVEIGEMGNWGNGEKEELYHQHWQQMQQRSNSPLALQVKQALSQHPKGLTLSQLALELKEDEFDIEEVLEKWYEFLLVNQEEVYRFYDYNFATWLNSH